jgi:hypothetical protein
MTNRILLPPSSALALASSFELQAGKQAALLVTNVVDDSSSIDAYGNTKAIQRAYNASLDTYVADPDQTRQVFVSTLLINAGWLYQAKPPKKAARLDDKNYAPSGNTPLFPQTLEALDFVSRAAEYLTSKGLEVYSMTNILTDGADNSGQTPALVRPVVSGIQESDCHIVAGIAVRDGTTDFLKVFLEMGILEKWIKVVERQEGEIVAEVSRCMSTATRASTVNKAAWRRTMVGGFGPDPKK